MVLEEHHSYHVLFHIMMMTLITREGEGRGDTSKESKATKSEGRCPKEGARRALCGQRD